MSNEFIRWEAICRYVVRYAMERSARWLKSSILRYTQDPSRGKKIKRRRNRYKAGISDKTRFIYSRSTQGQIKLRRSNRVVHSLISQALSVIRTLVGIAVPLNQDRYDPVRIFRKCQKFNIKIFYPGQERHQKITDQESLSCIQTIPVTDPMLVHP